MWDWHSLLPVLSHVVEAQALSVSLSALPLSVSFPKASQSSEPSEDGCFPSGWGYLLSWRPNTVRADPGEHAFSCPPRLSGAEPQLLAGVGVWPPLPWQG